MGEQRLAFRPAPRTVRRQIDPPRMSRGLWRVVVAGTVVGVALLGGVIYRMSRPVAVEPTVVLAHGTVEVTLDADAFVARREWVYRAPSPGAVFRLVDEGQRVRVGSAVVAIGPGQAASSAPPQAPAQPAPADQQAARKAIDDLSRQIYQLAAAINQAKAQGDAAQQTRLQEQMDQLAARQWELARQVGGGEAPLLTATAGQAPAGGARVVVDAAGVLVYQTDGLEEALNPAGTGKWTPSWFRTLAPNLRRTGEGQVSTGDSLFKVVDNLSLGLVTVVPASELAGLPPDTPLVLRFPGRDGRPVNARIARREQEGDQVLLHLTAPVFPEELTQLRRVRVTLVFGSYSGKVVPRSAIDVRDGRQGIWVDDGGEFVFRPVRVLGGNSEQVAMETAVPPGVRVLRQAPAAMR